MDPRIPELKRRARELAAGRPQPAFMLDCAEEISHASELFFDHPLILKLQGDALGFLNEPCGVGVEHGKRVAIDAAALVLAEPCGLGAEERRRLALLAEMAGLLHDALNHEEDHAEKGADLCLRILRGYDLTSEERIWIAQAVALHEAPLAVEEAGPVPARLLSAALHDADCFRFGPDIFNTVLWELCDCAEWPLARMATAFGEGLARAEQCLSHLRTEQGRRYGPGLIQEGLALGKEHLRALERLLAEDAPNT